MPMRARYNENKKQKYFSQLAERLTMPGDYQPLRFDDDDFAARMREAERIENDSGEEE